MHIALNSVLCLGLKTKEVTINEHFFFFFLVELEETFEIIPLFYK